MRTVALLAITVSWAAPALAGTDFGVRTVGPSKSGAPPGAAIAPSGRPAAATLASVVAIGSDWGRVTSTLRSPAHNRRVGGVPNSFHLSGRAIDIARRQGVTHAQIADAYRRAGYRLVESLDEGDHSHFAFSFGAAPARVAPTGRSGEAARTVPGKTQWRIVTAASARLRH